MLTVKTKKCRICGLEKPLDEFPMGRAYRDGHENRCKAVSDIRATRREALGRTKAEPGCAVCAKMDRAELRWYPRRSRMGTIVNSIPAQRIKQHGITAVDDLLDHGPVHVIMRNEPRYVVMDERQYEDLIDQLRGMRHDAFVAGVMDSMAQMKAGNVQRYDSAAALMAELLRDDDSDEDE